MSTDKKMTAWFDELCSLLEMPREERHEMWGESLLKLSKKAHKRDEVVWKEQ